MNRRAAISAFPVVGMGQSPAQERDEPFTSWFWSWTLYDDRGYGIACQPVGPTSTDPVACAQHLADVLQGTLNPAADWIAVVGGGVRLFYDTLCPFYAGIVCVPSPGEEVCGGCGDRATVAAIEAVSEGA